MPSVARLVEYGRKVCATGYRDELKVAALPKRYAIRISEIISNGFNMPCIALPDYLNLTLTPSNPILHTTRLYTLFKDYIPEKTKYNSVPLFYEDWNNKTTELLFKCDQEVQNLCHALNEFDLSEVKSLKVHYENDTVVGFTNKIQSIAGFKGLPSPTIKMGNKFIPDLKSRYFTADFNYGLNIIMQIGKLFNVKMSNCQMIYNWYDEIKDTSFSEFSLLDYGIKTKQDFMQFYKK